MILKYSPLLLIFTQTMHAAEPFIASARTSSTECLEDASSNTRRLLVLNQEPNSTGAPKDRDWCRPDWNKQCCIQYCKESCCNTKACSDACKVGCTICSCMACVVGATACLVFGCSLHP